MATKVYAPNEAFTGSIAGVVFTDGVGEFDPKKAPSAARYFERQGFGIGRRAPKRGTSEAERDWREQTTAPHQVGTPLRDAAVDPHPEDFLPPVNAGKADPHGPHVVAPEIHHDGPKGIRAGEVYVDDVDRQEAEEQALAEKALIERRELPIETFDEDADRGPLEMSDPGSVEQGVAAAEESGPPARSASKAAWVDYAVSRGANRDEAEGMTRADLIEAHGG